MTVVRLRENAPWTEHELTSEQATALLSSGLARVAPGPGPGLWRLRDNGLVGAARTGPVRAPVELRVEPKTPIDRLLFLLGYARNPRGWRQEDVDAGDRPDLLPALAHAFARSAERALRQGVLLGYRETEEALPVVRGRIRMIDQVRRRHGLPVPVEVRYDDYTTDIAENRLLLAAAHRLLSLPGVPMGTRRLLRHLPLRLDGVERLVPGRPPPAWTPTRLNTRYHSALGLAGLVLRSASYELDDGTALRVDGLMLEMWRVFEDYLCVALAEALRPYGHIARLQDKRHHLDRAHRVRLRPDLVLDTADGRPFTVVDAKYKVDDTPQSDLYQVLAYCTAMNLRRGYLVYASKNETHTHLITGTEDVQIVEAALDLSAPPEALAVQVTELARRIAADHVSTGGASGRSATTRSS
ncbi:McrC family protein [Actinomadura madurae]|uniref:McrC family protein n=1 Tax=Actinomadura madurae TaxID=1993 RepID=UPI0020D1F6A2|nr:McrC family protein [Actinomadura madurae]MCP9948666.1 McrC family protein [Actinomadura madurae]MCP9965438.1 McrC family protein [Actinomadura madurae]MCP9977929.1 McrC family protein [Actinomadura madurae]MCQ0010570.1 McrC family protein [Actinomadura madurae]MCQ0014119.1 McrC family protein [Actinomadura madurae]